MNYGNKNTLKENEDRELEYFYSNWSSKLSKKFVHDLRSAERKFQVIYPKIEKYLNTTGLELSIIDYGCGYGTFLECFQSKKGSKSCFGFDFSKSAINYAKSNYGNQDIKYFELSSLDSIENAIFIKEAIKPLKKVKIISLIDLLEHVPNCHLLIGELSSITKYFLIKLPIENSIFDNYLRKKQYPGLEQSNGHVREFTANSVYYFIRQLGLDPIIEDTYIYNISDTFPPMKIDFNNKTITQKFKHLYRIIQWVLIKYFKYICSLLMPKKIFLRLIGGGGYYCLATYNENIILHP